MKTIFVDVMLRDRWQFIMPYKYCEAFKINLADVYQKVINKRPSLEGKPFEMYLDLPEEATKKKKQRRKVLS